MVGPDYNVPLQHQKSGGVHIGFFTFRNLKNWWGLFPPFPLGDATPELKKTLCPISSTIKRISDIKKFYHFPKNLKFNSQCCDRIITLKSCNLRGVNHFYANEYSKIIWIFVCFGFTFSLAVNLGLHC